MNPDSTGAKVLQRLDSRYVKERHGVTIYQGSAPYRTGSDGDACCIEISSDGEYGRWKDFRDDSKKGSLYDLALELGIQPNYKSNGNGYAARGDYKDLADYASDKGDGALEALLAAGWTDIVHANSRAIRIPIPSQKDGIAQIRYLENVKPSGKNSKYTWERSGGVGRVWYGLNHAVQNARDGLIILCNGAPSVVIGSLWQLPVFAQVGGEGELTPDNLVQLCELLSKHDLKVMIALDCDTKGRESAVAIQKQLGDRGAIVDLEMSQKDDLADFARLWGYSAFSALKTRYDRISRHKPPTTALDASRYVTALTNGEISIEGRYLPFPFTVMHQFGGGVKWLQPRLLTGFVGVSGGGKTSCMESCVEALLCIPASEGRLPYGILWDGREFAPEIYHVRRIQRYLDQIYNAGKPNQFAAPAINSDNIFDWIVYQNEAAWGVPELNRLGIKPNEQDLKWIQWVGSRVEKWNGSLEYIPQFDYLEQTLEYMRDKTIALRKAGQSVDLWVHDHINLYRLKNDTLQGSQENVYNLAVQTIKDMARMMNVHVFIGVQVNKLGTNDMKQRNKRLAAKDMHFVNDTHFNAIVAINMLFEADMLWDEDTQSWYDKLDANGDKIIAIARCENGDECAILECLKNSFGRTGMTNVRADLRHLRFRDDTWFASDKRYSMD